jgi:hypothetical protein
MVLWCSPGSAKESYSQKIAKDAKTNLDAKGHALGQPLDRSSGRMVSPRWYLFVIFVTFCENGSLVFPGSAKESYSQKIAKDAKTNLDAKGHALGQPLDRSSGRMVSPGMVSLCHWKQSAEK